MDFYGFYTGKLLDAYTYLGCHLCENEAVFRTFAPSAEKISVIGDMCRESEIPMHKIYDGNFWECVVPQVHEGMRYQYRIYQKDGTYVDHADPYGFGMELPPRSASVVRALDSFHWRDTRWMKHHTDCRETPLNIYEVHLGSWKRKDPDIYPTYTELAEPLIRYVKEHGYNYIELMPLAEHPCDNSWGYQQTGFYSPTARYGTPDDLRFLIDYAHRHNVGVILDFVPVHFAVDDYGLANYDGTPLYEYPHIDIGMSEWGSKNFNHSRGEVQSFLQSNALYWIKEFHFDGLRIDALSNILYWQGNSTRGVNARAVGFIQSMNQALKKYDPSVMLIAEDSTAFEGVTRSVADGGLGFDYKWDMGWMNDTLAYFQTPPHERTREYHKLTFSMMYFPSEHFLLPFSHDEVVHGKATILQKMWGDYENKFPQARALYLFMYVHPGKKLNFMANEIGQLREWDETREQDWNLLSYPLHHAFAEYSKALCKTYEKSPALYQWDYRPEGFRWVDCRQEERCIYVIERRSKEQRMLALFNFSAQEQTYALCGQDYTALRRILASDDEHYGGCHTYSRLRTVKSKNGMFSLPLRPFSGVLFEILSD